MTNESRPQHVEARSITIGEVAYGNGIAAWVEAAAWGLPEFDPAPTSIRETGPGQFQVSARYKQCESCNYPGVNLNGRAVQPPGGVSLQTVDGLIYATPHNAGCPMGAA
jgi:hypothetical protein